eukprot:NODE_2299_length_1237_cov_375.235690_g2095_i0.p1 GENE.NODE_2299_length_1237_cov_375.235690_g2095_i0~~NODE_2299_length_1237_cov_375.235690_g2095_i0.p1  ORF type:complete len:298 (-),score=74.06 NODE_2299_length_1237_cov_375.235690_g2095_i0:252-1145(-)
MAPKKATPAPKKVAPPKPKPKSKPAKSKSKTAKQQQQQQGPKRVKQCPVYIRNLDFEGMNHDTIKDVFKPCGTIAEVRLRHGRFVLIFFRGKAAAEKAVEMNGKTVKGNKIKVVFARKAKPTRQREHYCTTVWCGGLPGGTTEKQLEEHFKEAGRILKVRIARKKHQGWVYFQNNKDTKKAMTLADKPFAHGKDVSQLEEIPIQWQRKLELRYSIRTKLFDMLRNRKRFNRRPPSVIKAGLRKSRARREARKAAKELAAGKKNSSSKKSSSKKKAVKKTDSSTKKSSTTKKASGTKE